jgi:selenide,water dikinase
MLLAGFDYSEDAAVYKLDDERALIATLDFFTPIVDDPYTFGAIAAANSLSDVYAMGGQPKLALNIVGFPGELSLEVLREILKGGADKVKEAGALLVGGHSIKDDEPKFGLSVIGFVKNEDLLLNGGAKVGDKLILTKALGTGIVTTGIKAGVVSKEMAEEVIFSMQYLNKYALEALGEQRAHGATDITGFGLVGHLMEMMEASGTSANLDYEAIPFFQGVDELVEMRAVPGGTFSNKKHYECRCDLNGLTTEEVLPLFDAQTSGGLLLSVDGSVADELIERLRRNVKTPVAIIGEVVEQREKRIYVKRR